MQRRSRTAPAATPDGELDEREREALRRAADLLAGFLDTAIPLPGTRIRIGIDPLLGLIPGIGDVAASLIGSTILLLAVRLRAPRITLVRMSLNLLINGAVGVVPGAGDLFSLYFRSNVRNVALLRRVASPEARRSARGDWAFVLAVLLAALALVAGAAAGLLWLIARLWELVR